jgi:hypothetical protein
MQICVQDLFDAIFSRTMRYDIVSTYDTLIFSLCFNYLPYHYFCGLDRMILPKILALWLALVVCE